MGRVLVLIVAPLLGGCGSQPVTHPASSASARTPTPSAITSATTTAIPLGRSGAGMAYDQTRHTVVLFGGIAGEALFSDTWTWNGSAWTQRQGLTAGPSARQRVAMAYDEGHRQVILFGGIGAQGTFDDTWMWDGNAWQLLSPVHHPSKREGAAVSYDPALSAIVLYGGVDPSSARPSPINDTWSWNGTDWSQLQPAPSPAGGARPRLAFLSGANLVERFGDCAESHDNALYAFDGHSWGPHTATGSWPPALCLPSLAGDTSRRQLVLFGGNPGTGGTPVPAETWIYDGSVWKKATPAQSPSPRDDAGMVYDSDHRLMVLFGGQGLVQGQAGPLNDTWTWDGSAWTQHQ